MILVDYSNVSISAIMAMTFNSNTRIDEDIVKHTILNSIRSRNVELKGTFGNLYIICDDTSAKCWRYSFFPYYKANRRKNRKEDSSIDWNKIFKCMDEVKMDLLTSFPYPVISEKYCEADDIIGHTALHATEATVIVSNDKDYKQCHSDLVCQYRPNLKKLVKSSDPQRDLKELIISGDPEDGVPNFRSPDDIFIRPDERQKPITKKNLEVWLDDEKNTFLAEEVIKAKKVKGVIQPEVRIDRESNYRRNQRLIDFRFIPDILKRNIDISMKDAKSYGTRSTVFKYLAEHRMKVLHGKLNDFF